MQALPSGIAGDGMSCAELKERRVRRGEREIENGALKR
jgi:hypothetical protein